MSKVKSVFKIPSNIAKIETFEIESGVVANRARINEDVLLKIIASVYKLRAKTTDSFVVPNNPENNCQPQSISGIIKNYLIKVGDKNTTVRTRILGNKKKPTGVRIWRIN